MNAEFLSKYSKSTFYVNIFLGKSFVFPETMTDRDKFANIPIVQYVVKR